MLGQQQQSLRQAEAGSIVALSRLDAVQTGDTLGVVDGSAKPELPRAKNLEPVYSLAITPRNRQDEVKISTAIAKLLEEDPSFHWEHREATHEMVLWGQGDIHLQVAIDRLERKYHLSLKTHTPHIPYKESIRKATS
ncbi:MAG: elongation factor G, partial [Acaryochloridaceae cyanobacterium CSU_5_19]|nr:elongation factor G [Acaryochloridaceae cyanobacterium CSU_5_19]